MNSVVTSAEQNAGSLLTGLYCSIGAKGVAATIVSRANTSLSFGTALESLGSGDIVGSTTLALSLIHNQNLDPAIVLALNNALQIEVLKWQALQGVASLVPFLSTDIEAVITNFAKGIVAGANAELAKYAPVTPATTAA